MKLIDNHNFITDKFITNKMTWFLESARPKRRKL